MGRVIARARESEVLRLRVIDRTAGRTNRRNMASVGRKVSDMLMGKRKKEISGKAVLPAK